MGVFCRISLSISYQVFRTFNVYPKEYILLLTYLLSQFLPVS
jgi:hypothetical protein